MDAAVEIGLEQSVSVLNLLLQLLGLFSNHPSFNTLLLFDLPGFLLRCKLIYEDSVECFELDVAFPVSLDCNRSSIFDRTFINGY